MKKTTKSHQEKILHLAQLLEEDFKSSEEKQYPELALPALHNSTVQKHLLDSYEQGKVLTGIFELGRDPNIGVSYLFFSLSEDQSDISREGLLCLMDSNCEIMGMKHGFNIPEPDQHASLPFVRSSASNPFVFTQETAAAPKISGGAYVGMGADFRDGGRIGLTPLPGTGGPDVPDFGGPVIPGHDWPPRRGRITPGQVFDGKTDTSCQICKPVMTFVPVPPGGGYSVQDSTHCAQETDDCGSTGLFSAELSFKL